MKNFAASSRLIFFKAEKYVYEQDHRVDNENCPRPHFCMGYVITGSADFYDCIEDKHISVKQGDIIFVPITSRYISDWKGNPQVNYISMHFIFDCPGIFSRHRDYKLQKVSVKNTEEMQGLFEYILQNYNGQEEAQLSSLSKFYAVLSKILTKLEAKNQKEMDPRMKLAIHYMEDHFTENITVERLAEISSMSVSRFFPNFKKAVGVTPVEYLNHYRISQAIILLMNEEDLSIEEISERLGFESSTYFRRVFKKITGKTPRDYRKSSMEI